MMHSFILPAVPRYHSYSRLFLMAGLLGIMVPMAGCYTVIPRGTPIQQRDVIIEQQPPVTITPYPSTDSRSSNRLPQESATLPRSVPQKAAPPNTAVLALLDNAKQQSRSGKLDAAAAALERALRIDPRNADIWYRLAAVRLQQGQFGQAASLAAKSMNLAGNDVDLIERNEEIIDKAKRHQK